MKTLLFIAGAFMIALLISCSGQKNTTGPSTAGTTTADTIDKALIHKELKGKWNVVTMNRSENGEPEAVPGVFITLADSSFGGKAPCNHIGGVYSMEGDSSISFSDIISTKMACERSDQENAFLNLLSNKVTTYTVTEHSLLLKDASSHVILECIKQ